MMTLTNEDRARAAYEDEQYAAWAAEHSDQLVTEAYLAWVETLCEGHESLRGDAMGAEVYCDGTCRPLRERTRDAWVDALDAQLPED